MRRWIPFAWLLSCTPPDKANQGGGWGETGEAPYDGDGDGFGAEEDCNDSDSSVSPGTSEICDGIDNNCDGDVDEGVEQTYYQDSDEDGFGDPDVEVRACTAPEDAVSNGGDCDDASELVYPGAIEICDGLDNDCDGSVDDDELAPWYRDADGDGYGDAGAMVEACAQPEGTVANAEDCDDDSEEAYPGAEEVCDEIDNDCDGEVDEDSLTTYFEDRDGDGYGVGDSVVEACTTPAGYADEAGDCDDADGDYHPGAEESDCADPHDYNCDGSVGYADADGDGYAACEDCDDRSAELSPAAAEVCNDLDDDCDGYTDDLDPSVDPATRSAWYDDDDGDGYGDPLDVELACAAPAGAVEDGTDCDDRLDSVHPGAAEVCNGRDDDCDFLVDDADSSLDAATADTWYADGDGDGHGSPSSSRLACEAPPSSSALGDDCDDSAAAVHPGATEVCNEIDDDCDSLVDDADSGLDLSSAGAWYADGDGDGWGAGTVSRSCDAPTRSSASAGDCDDAAAAVFPGADELCNDLDDDCDGLVDDADPGLEGSSTSAWYVDADSDGHGSSASSLQSCDPPTGSVASADDCDDGDAAISPDATEVCNDRDDDCDARVDDADSSLDLSTGTGWYDDDDADGYGDPSDSLQACDLPTGHSANDDDCDDSSAAISPADAEICDGLDNDCDAAIDDDDPGLDLSTTTTWYVDSDGDGYGASASSLRACDAPASSAAAGGDCDDSDRSVSPAATEVCNAEDDNCDGVVDTEAACGCELEYYSSDYSHPYLYCRSAQPWSSAQSDCISKGYRLVTIGSSAENEWVDSTADLYSTDRWWMGFNDQASEGSWVWESGAAVTYTNWHSGEPNDVGGEDCGQVNRFHPTTTWNDETCAQSLYYICEAD